MSANTAPGGAAYLVDKPAGPTSHDVIAQIRRSLGRGTKVGHAGTLDPFATGLLVVLAGRATRLARYLVGLDKTYLVRARLGAVSATGDPEGPITETGRSPDPEALAAVLGSLVGRIRQRVPAHSAVQVDGERLYRKARRGEDVERPEREVVIERLTERARDPDLAWIDLEVRCSSGTYIRSLVEDVGELAGCGAYCLSLRRTAVGDLSIDGAVPPDRVGPDAAVSPAAVLGHLPMRELTQTEAAAVAHGRAIEDGPEGEGPLALVRDGALVAVGRAEAGRVRAEVVLA